MLVATAIAENSLRLRGRASPLTPAAAAPIALQGSVIAPDEVARRVVQAIEARRFYVFTHPEQRELLRRRARRQDEVFESGWEEGGPR